MATLLQLLQLKRLGRAKRNAQAVEKPAMVSRAHGIETPPFDIAPNDPLVADLRKLADAMSVNKIRA
jgi:hypothetical protein